MNFDFIESNGLGAGFVYKDNQQGWYFNGTNFIQIVSPNYPSETVRGLVYLNGTYYVMTPEGAIYGSDIENPANWSALNVIQSLSEPDGGVCLARQLNLIVSFGEYSTEFFYDAANPTGSPLGRYESTFLQIGCATAGSVVTAENNLVFMSQGRQKGRAIQVLEGTNPTQISTTAINRILDADDLEDVTAFFIKLAGNTFYILTLPSSDVTLVYNFESRSWARWSQLTPGPSRAVTEVSWADKVLTITVPNHGFVDGQVIYTRMFLPQTYNVTRVINVIDNNTISFFEPTDPGELVQYGLITGCRETHFRINSYTKSEAFDIVQDSTTGAVYSLDSGVFLDATLPIVMKIRTANMDGGTSDMKFFNKIEIISDEFEGTSFVRYTNDDYRTWSKYRPVDMNVPRKHLVRMGRARRRAHEIINIDNKPVRIQAMDLTVDKGFV
jgi:hypothetical protein